jgi:hypothetical protein
MTDSDRELGERLAVQHLRETIRQIELPDALLDPHLPHHHRAREDRGLRIGDHG